MLFWRDKFWFKRKLQMKTMSHVRQVQTNMWDNSLSKPTQMTRMKATMKFIWRIFQNYRGIHYKILQIWLNTICKTQDYFFKGEIYKKYPGGPALPSLFLNSMELTWNMNNKQTLVIESTMHNLVLISESEGQTI